MFATTASQVRHHLITLIVTCFLQPALGSFDLVRCCVKAARDVNIMRDTGLLPWDTCHFGEDPQYPSEEYWKPVARTRAWCKAECTGYQPSETAQWLQPLASWIAPYIAVILLCPIGEGSEKEDLEEDQEAERANNGEDQHAAQDESHEDAPTLFQSTTALINAVWKFLKTVVGEYVLLLGDPASALWGAFSEIIADLKKAQRLERSGPSWLSKNALWITMLAGDTKFNSDRLLKGFTENLGNDVSGHTTWETLAKESAKQSAPKGKSTSIGEDDEIVQRSKDGVKSSTAGLPSAQGSLSEAQEHAIQALVQGRISFSKGIFLPVILTIAVAASVFFDGYGKLGDKDTAHALAYGVWYSWIITLCVAANCFATSTNVGLARKAFGKSLRLSHRRVSLAQRYTNAFEWDRWQWRIEHATDVESDTASGPKQNGAFWFKFLIGQLAGWACVAFACACAAVISWTTPTVGLGCRSFNFILYAIGTFCVAFLHVLCERLRCLRSTSTDRPGLREMAILYLYWAIAIFNSAVLVIGTILHLSGVYRSCWCSRLFAADDTMIEFQRNTELGYKNARAYWLVTGYVAFSFVWVIGSVCVAARKYIVWKIEQALRDD
jgi:hypothetical protein